MGEMGERRRAPRAGCKGGARTGTGAEMATAGEERTAAGEEEVATCEEAAAAGEESGAEPVPWCFLLY